MKCGLCLEDFTDEGDKEIIRDTGVCKVCYEDTQGAMYPPHPDGSLDRRTEVGMTIKRGQYERS